MYTGFGYVVGFVAAAAVPGIISDSSITESNITSNIASVFTAAADFAIDYESTVPAETREIVARSFYLYFSARVSGIDPSSAFDAAYALVSRISPIDLASYATAAVAAIDENAARVANINSIRII